MKELMIDYRIEDENGDVQVRRKEIDNFEFCVRNGLVYFRSDDRIYQVPLQDVSQVYLS